MKMTSSEARVSTNLKKKRKKAMMAFIHAKSRYYVTSISLKCRQLTSTNIPQWVLLRVVMPNISIFYSLSTIPLYLCRWFYKNRKSNTTCTYLDFKKYKLVLFWHQQTIVINFFTENTFVPVLENTYLLYQRNYHA